MSATPERTEPAGMIATADGEALELNAPSDTLAAAIVELDRRERQFKAWRQAAEAELLERLREKKRRRAIVGDFEIEIAASGRARVWDPDELEATLVALEAAGTLRATEVADLLTPQPPKVNGKRAAELLTRVAGSAREALEGCFHWEQKSRPRLTITRSIPLLAPDGAHEAAQGAQEGTK